MPATARVAALRALALRRLTEVQLWKKLEQKGYPGGDVCETVAWCKQEGYIDDALFARLFVETSRKQVSDARLVAELQRRGVNRAVAAQAVAASECTQDDRLRAAFEKIARKASELSYPIAARRLERLGFPAPAIYRLLRDHAACFGPLAGLDLNGTGA